MPIWTVIISSFFFCEKLRAKLTAFLCSHAYGLIFPLQCDGDVSLASFAICLKGKPHFAVLCAGDLFSYRNV